MRIPFSLAFVLALPALVRAEPPGKVDCAVTENGKPASGWFRVLEADKEIGKGSCGKGLDVPAGNYEMVVGLDGAADAPEQRERSTVKSGQTATTRASFETGELLVEVTRGGRRGVATVRLLKGTGTLATLSAGVASRVSTGTYTVEVESRGDKRRFDAVSVSSSERRVISVDFGS
jgi:hypothetical protein